MFKWLTRLLNRHPIIGPIISAGALTALGDAIAQHWIEDRPVSYHDWARSIRQLSYGLFIIGPGVCFWFRFLDARIRHSSIIRQTFLRVGVDQVLFTPITLGTYFIYNARAEGCGWTDVKMRLENNYTTALMANYKLWPVAQALNFTIIPLNYRVIFVNFVAIGWNAYLSNLNAKNIIK